MIGDLICWEEFGSSRCDVGIIIDVCTEEYKIKWTKYKPHVSWMYIDLKEINKRTYSGRYFLCERKEK